MLVLKIAEFLIASLKLYRLGFPLIHVAENTYETDFNQMKVIFLLHKINLEVSRLELVCYTPGLFCLSAPNFLRVTKWLLAVAITSTFHVVELAPFRELSWKPHPTAT